MKRRTLLAGALATACSAPIATATASPAATGTDRVEALLARMSVADRAGQIMSVAFHGTKITAHVERMIRERHVGGVVLFKENFDDAASLRRLTTDLQRIAREAGIPPLLVALDQEGGPVARVARGAAVMPGQMAIAATPDPLDSVRRAVAVTANELRAMGVNWNLAPVADVNDEPRNPIIGNRAFGSDPARVAVLVQTAVRAYADAGLLCATKHFPGHGSTTVDSHSGLPLNEGSRARLDAVELVPFRAAIAAGVPAIMSAHIRLPALDPTPDLPGSLSPAIGTDLLRTQLGFAGLCLTDDLEMGALSAIGGEAKAGARAIAAGADYVLYRFDEGAQLEGNRLIVEGAASGSLPLARLAAAVRRVLATKSRWGILDDRPATAFDVTADREVALDLARKSVTVLRGGGLPLAADDRVLAVAVANPDIALLEDQSTLGETLAQARPGTTAKRLSLQPSDTEAQAVLDAARGADAVVFGSADLLTYPAQAKLVNALRTIRPLVLVSLRHPYDVLAAPDVAGYVCAYDGRDASLRATSEILLGTRQPVGRLPVSIGDVFKIGDGMLRL